MKWRFDAIEDAAVYWILTVAASKRGRPYADRISFWRSYSRCRLAFVGAFELSLRWGYEPTELPMLNRG